ncbi:MAG: hypothetical protein MI785_06860, partial [Kiloniellales bacterium]|nr:hypothetical protein [Kiloniellales bacterium]
MKRIKCSQQSMRCLDLKFQDMKCHFCGGSCNTILTLSGAIVVIAMAQKHLHMAHPSCSTLV